MLYVMGLNVCCFLDVVEKPLMLLYEYDGGLCYMVVCGSISSVGGSIGFKTCP